MPLFLLIFVLSQLTASQAFAQDKNRTEEIYHFGKVVISSESLPDKVYEAQKNKVLVSVMFIEKGTDNVIATSVGTGFVTENPGVIITARHLMNEAQANVEKVKNEKIKSNPKFEYSLMFMGTIITDTAWTNFPLSLVAIGEKGTFKDMLALRTDVVTMDKARDNTTNQNSYALLLRTSKFVDTNVGDKAYITGFAPVVVEYLGKNDQTIPVYADLIDHVFTAEVEVQITDMPINNVAGVKMLYRLRDSAEPGFSGGKVLNSQGEVIGMTIAMSLSRNFVYVLSSQDIKQFLKDNKLK